MLLIERAIYSSLPSEGSSSLGVVRRKKRRERIKQASVKRTRNKHTRCTLLDIFLLMVVGYNKSCIPWLPWSMKRHIYVTNGVYMYVAPVFSMLWCFQGCWDSLPESQCKSKSSYSVPNFELDIHVWQYRLA